MEAKWLEDFLSLSDTKSFSRSARSRHLTQSAFSRRIVALETWMGAKLVDRSVNPITLTPAGRMFRSLAADILRSMTAARNLVGGYEQFAENDHVVHFAVAHTLVFTLFPDWLKRLTSEFGHIMARVQAVNVPEGVQHLVAGDCDLLIGYHHPQLPIALDPNHFPFLTLGVERIVPVSAVANDGKPLFELPGKSSRPLPLLAYSSGAFLGNVVEMLLMNATEPYALFRCFETHMSEALKGMVVAGHGIGWLPESCITKELSEGNLARAGSNVWATELEIRLYRPLKERGQAAERLWAFISNQVNEPRTDQLPDIVTAP
ncbi:LysR substrate-binding domain-containing protein [Paraburkholderia silvatlantica]|uniref:LysR family transcriptional regulator n=1 Tax=Paraburkholderia silvatlantica TaxID=321895 RepID=A0A2U1AAJ1_9BURK|nr:LysR substrate-binding domain-containing protein [Paraburkholderia silvatlantica]PVY31127.1 LysR family transcriptional regulator [Paraburkholderia silvatlantica]PXW37264.1 LysR family transcriptional regulator [Paraburkholderia silvatlantica]PYE19592.1 LysR family transcriptional regulator [Paraburkholderia silvatlantica]TDQ77502.1 LysR family transcriptional regulator [Paraburkholderia silvatlantica]